MITCVLEWTPPCVRGRRRRAARGAGGTGGVLLAGDVRIGALNKKAKIGTNEVHIGLPLSSFALPLMRSRLSPLHLTRAATLGTIYSPKDAVAIGFLDELTEAERLEEVAIRTAASLAKLGLQGRGGAFHTTKLHERREVLDVRSAPC